MNLEGSVSIMKVKSVAKNKETTRMTHGPYMLSRFSECPVLLSLSPLPEHHRNNLKPLSTKLIINFSHKYTGYTHLNLLISPSHLYIILSLPPEIPPDSQIPPQRRRLIVLPVNGNLAVPLKMQVPVQGSDKEASTDDVAQERGNHAFPDVQADGDFWRVVEYGVGDEEHVCYDVVWEVC